MVNQIGFPMHQVLGTYDLCSKCLANRLMSQANAEQGNFTGKPLGAWYRNAGFARGAGPWGDDHAIWFPVNDLLDGDLIVANHLNLKLSIDLPQSLHQVIRKRVVIIDQQNHAANKCIDFGRNEPLFLPLRSMIR